MFWLNVKKILLLLCTTQLFDVTSALTVDNQLVSARSDCFERIALEAMLPFEKTFRTDDTNSLKMCKEKCLQAGEKCQSIAFGVHRRGNGTCQLSEETYGMTSGRPTGVIFDPDFDLYARKTNCFDLSDNAIASPDSPSGANAGNGNAYGAIAPTPPVNLPNRPVDINGQPLLVVNPTPSTAGTPFNDRPIATPTVSTYGSTYPTTPEYVPISTLGPASTDGDRLYFSQDIYPLYKYPMLYEHNYPAPNVDYYIPGGYAANVPPVDDHYRPVTTGDDNIRPTPQGPPKPIFGLGYGNGYSYSNPEPYHPSSNTQRPHHVADEQPPQYPPTPHSYANGQPTTNQQHTTNTATSYRPDQDQPAAVDYTNRPDPPLDSYGASARPPMRDPSYEQPNRYDMVKRNGTAGYPDSYDDDKRITTYFNPEDYMNKNKHKGQHNNGNRGQYGYSMDHVNACFRRVLAGKRVAPHWVRRTIACERVEDCMRECGQEKRFMCEGFNYRLDPTGNGQGDCELVEIPLAEIDLYSNPQHRDSNLLRHSDYDYYERDRNAPSSCRKNICRDCSSPPIYLKPHWSDAPNRPSYSSSGSSGGGYIADTHSLSHNPSSTAIDRYRPAGPPPPPPPQLPPASYEHRPPPPPHSSEYHHSSSYEYASHGSSYFEHTPPSSYGSSNAQDLPPIDRYDTLRPAEHRPFRPERPSPWTSLSSTGIDSSAYHSHERPLPRPEPDRIDRFRPPYRPGPEYTPHRPALPPPSAHSHSDSYRPPPPSTHSHSDSYRPPPPPPPAPHNYLDRDDAQPHKKPNKFVPYLIDSGDSRWGSYGGSYGSTYGSSYKKQNSYYGVSDYERRKDSLKFNYFDLGGRRDPNAVQQYPGSSYGATDRDVYGERHDYRRKWTRRPGPDECSAKTSEGFRLHKTAVKHAYTVPTLTECERLCSGQDGFVCQTFSYRYSNAGRDNCMLCDRPVNLLDYYVDIEPDRDYDIYSMADDMNVCKQSRLDGHNPGTALADPRKAQCFFRAIDATRFFKSIVRDSLTVRTVGECEMECVKSTRFTCRAFAFRYGQQRHAGVIDNCQLSDWPVRDMDKQRHLILDATFDIFERASYGHGCEIQPLVDEKNKKLCYLGYGSPAKLLPAAIKKVISATTEAECKRECIRFRETTSFKCYSFSYGPNSKSYNCEMSDLDQTELNLNVHYTHTTNRDYWLFAWNPFDWTCRDKTNTIGGSRVNNDRRMDFLSEPGEVAWRHYSVSGKPCRKSSPCEKNLITGFYSCEIDGGEIGAWDYCCKMEHPCGYSRGFDYPWCFVGDEPDQWRKCSDRYYPDNRPQSLIDNKKSVAKISKRKQTASASQQSHEYQHPPRPGGLQSLSDFAAARLWPVTYLYSEGPPNATEISNFVDCNKETC